MHGKNNRDDTPLISSLSMFKTIMDHSIDSLYFKDKDFRFIAVNKNKAIRHGIENPSEMNGKTDFDFISERDAKEIFEAEKSILETGRPIIGKIEKLTRLDGSITWASSSKYPLYDENSDLIGIWGISRDITEYELAKEALRESEERYSQLSEQSRTYTWEVDEQALFTYVNPMCEVVLGYRADELVCKKHFYDLSPEKEREVLKQAAAAAFTHKTLFHNLEYKVLTKDGHAVWLSTNGIPMLKDDGTLRGYRGSDTDITERKKAEDALKENENRLVAAQQMAHVGNWELNLDTKNIWASEESFNIYGIEHNSKYLPLEIVQEVVCPEYRKLLDSKLINLIAKKEKYDVEFKIKKANTGEERFVQSKAILLVDEKGNASKVIGTIQDTTERKKKEEEILYLSYHDQLTGLYNRRFYEEELKRLDTERNLPLTIAMGDVNGLKLINDSFGHAMGDDLLKKVAEVIKKGCREDDIIARLGGDEFVIILPKTGAFETEKIIKRINQLSLKEKVGNIDTSISFGYETKNNEEEKIQEVVKKAEDSMYKNKLFDCQGVRGKTISAIVSTLNEKNKREEQHSHRVSVLCKRMGEALGLPENEIEELESVGSLHDIGKIAIDADVLNKSGKLTADEWKEIRRHPEIGYRILSAVNDMSEMAEYVLDHHERWDGKGYPRGLKGEELPVVSRIIAIADAYDAMTSERNYRGALPVEVALAELHKNAGIQFDPNLIRVFIEKVLEKDL